MKPIRFANFNVFFQDKPLVFDDKPLDLIENAKRLERFRTARKQWHVVMLPMSPPYYRPQIEPDPPRSFEQGPMFKTEQEAYDWIKSNHP